MRYGDKIKMLRDYDRHRKGSKLVAGVDVTVGVAQALCGGARPFAEDLSKPTPKQKSDE